jgi:hypothetical protein
MKALRKQLTQDSAGALFAIEELTRMKKDESIPEKADDCSSAVSDTFSKDYPLRLQLIEALAEGYLALSADLQVKILRTLEDNYSPLLVCDLHGGRTVLDWALIRVGTDSIEVLVRLAKSPLRSVNCAADDLLTEIGKVAKSTQDITSPPQLDCGLTTNANKDADVWHAWWQRSGPRIDFHKIQDLVRDPPM